MKCLYPFVGNGRVIYPCGQCLPCRFNRRRIWAHRIMLEATCHEHSSFVTLTYRELPENGSLNPDHLRGWLKRLRFHYSPRVVRYFAVGEYGDKSWRPHYHAALFGVESCRGGTVRVTDQGRECLCRPCSTVRETWKHGFVMLGRLELSSSQYIAGYTVKKMGVGDARLAPGLYPEFARMSLRPGIGASAMSDVASVILGYQLEKRGDVPTVLAHGTTKLPLGRYLRGRLRREVGLDENAPPEYVEALRSGLLPLFEAADKAVPKGMGRYKRAVVAAAIGEENEQAARNLAARCIGKRRPL